MASTIRGSDDFDSATGGSTGAGDVGTYTVGRPASYAHYTVGNTVAGSSLVVTVTGAWFYGNVWQRVGAGGANATSVSAGTTRSGTWRLMSHAGADTSYWGHAGLWVRIS
jgi:hypothetical protein